MSRILLEIDGTCYTADGENWTPTSIDWVSPPSPLAVDYVITDHGSHPRFRQACGRKAYCEYVLAKDLRDEGELAGNAVLVVDAITQPSSQSCGIMFHVVDGQQHALRLDVVERGGRSTVLVSLGKVLAELLRSERCNACAYVVFHHDVIDVLISRGGEAQAVQRLYDVSALAAGAPGALAGRVADVLDVLQRQSKTTVERVVCHHFALNEGELPALERFVTELGSDGRTPVRLAPMRKFRIGERAVLGSLNRALRSVDAFAACSSRQSKWRRWAVEKLPHVAALLLVANFASLGWLEFVSAETAKVQTKVGEYAAPSELIAPELPEMSAVLPLAEAIDAAVRLPTVEHALADVAAAGNAVANLKIKSVELVYPGGRPKRRRAGADTVNPSALEIRLSGQINAAAVDAVARYDQLVGRLSDAGYLVRSGEVNTASKMATFSCNLERPAHE